MPTPSESYSKWLSDPTPQSMADVVGTLAPTINSEVQRYSGPKHLMRAQAKSIAVNAVKSYDPNSGAQLTSWLTTQMQPLSRYGREMSEPVKVGETAYRQHAAILRGMAELEEELGDAPSEEQLADHLGISAARIQKIRDMNRAVQFEGAGDDIAAASGGTMDDSVLQFGTNPAVSDAAAMTYASLDPRDKMIYDLRTGSNGKKQLDNLSIAKRLGVSPAFVSQRAAFIGQTIAQQAQHG